MKPFRFSLQTLYNHTEDREDEQKKKLAAIDQRLRRKLTEIETTELEMASLCRHFQLSMKKGGCAAALLPFNARFAELRQSQLQMQSQARNIEKEKEDCRQALIRLTREIQALDKLRDKQYDMYKTELAREEEKEIDAFVSFQQGQAIAVRGT